MSLALGVTSIAEISDGDGILPAFEPFEASEYSTSGPAGRCQQESCNRMECLVHCRNCQEIKRNCECTVGFIAGLLPDLALYGARRGLPFDGVKINMWAPASGYSAQNSIVTEHITVFWQNTGNWSGGRRPDCVSPGEVCTVCPINCSTRAAMPVDYRLPMPELCAEVDRIFEHIRDVAAYGSPDRNHVWDVFTMRIHLVHANGWAASGGTAASTYSGTSITNGAITHNVGSSKPFVNPITGHWEFATFVHELGHAFQFTTQLAANNTWFGGGYPNGQFQTETLAQYKLWSMYPHWFFYEHHGLSITGSSHAPFGLSENQWSHTLVFHGWADIHGQDFIGRFTRGRSIGASQVGSNSQLVEQYKFFTGINQNGFNKEIFEMAQKMVTWDFDHQRYACAPFANVHDSGFTNDGSDWYRVAWGRVPNSYGWNSIRLEVPEEGGIVEVDFKGLDQNAFPITTAQRSNAGWRYGFLAVDDSNLREPGGRTYGEMHIATFANPEGKATFEVPEGTQYLWLIVTGAPTNHYNNAQTSTAENWGYEIKLMNTALHMDNVEVDFTHLRHTTTLENAIAAAQARESEELEEALEAAIARLEEGGTQAQIDAAASALILAMFAQDGVTPSAVTPGLSQAAVRNQNQRNIARPQHGGFLTVSHIRHLFDNPEGVASLTRNMVDGILTNSAVNDIGKNQNTWNTERGVLDGFGGPEVIPWPPRSADNREIAAWEWKERFQRLNPVTGEVDRINPNPFDRHYIMIDFPHLMDIDSTRVRWHTSKILDDLARGAYRGTFLPSPDTYIEYWCKDTEDWVRIEFFINDVGQGAGRLGVLASSTANNLNWGNTRWNGASFDVVTTQAFRINTARSQNGGLTAGMGITQWEVFGERHYCDEYFEYAETIPPYCFTDGYDVYKCTRCGAEDEPRNIVPMLTVENSQAHFLRPRQAAVLSKGLTGTQLVLSAVNKATLTLVLDGMSIVIAENVNNKNVNGVVPLDCGCCELVFDIKGNGSNIKTFVVKHLR